MTSPELPPVDVVIGLAGSQRRVRLDRLRAGHTVRELLTLFPELRDAQSDVVDIDGDLVPCSTPIQGALRQGSALGSTQGALPTAQGATGRAAIHAVWTTGPDAGRSVLCAEGRHTLGSASDAALTSDDSAIARHQGIVTVESGGVFYEDLGIGRPSMIDGQPVSGKVELALGDSLETGGSTLVFRRSTDQSDTSMAVRSGLVMGLRSAAGASGASPWTQPCVRSNHAAGAAAPGVVLPATELVAGSSGVSPVGLVTAGVSLAGGGLLAVLLHQPLMILMVAIGAVGTFVTFGVQAFGSRRSARRVAGQMRQQHAEFVHSMSAAYELATKRASAVVQLDDAVKMASIGSIWSAAAPTVCLGIGDIPWTPRLLTPDGHDAAPEVGPTASMAAVLDEYSLLRRVPVTFDFVPGQVIGVVGHASGRQALVRSMLVQLAVAQGPSQWRLTVVAGHHVEDWQGWASWLPHSTTGVDAESMIVSSFDGATRQRLTESWDTTTNDGSGTALDVIVVANVGELVHRTSELRRFLSAHSANCALMVLGDAAETLSTKCTDLLEVGRTDSAWSRNGGSTPTVRFRMAGASGLLAAEVTRSLARWSDPELLDGDRGMPSAVDAIELFGAVASSAANIAAYWSITGVDPAPTAQIGLAADGPIDIDLDRDGPHMLVAGTTGAGKSELLRTLIAGLAVSASPEHLQLLLVDYKGGSAFDACAALPHVAGVVTDLDDRLAERVLRSLNAELVRRERLLREAGAENLSAYRRSGGTLARLVIIVDEFASLAAELVEFIPSIVDIARRGRSLGVHLVLATQRPAGVVNDDIRANTNLRIGLRLQDVSDSVDVVGTAAAAGLPRNRPGRAVIRFGADELVEVQVARSTGPYSTDAGGSRPQARVIDSSPTTALGRIEAAAGSGTQPGSSTDGSDSSLAVLVERVRRAARLAHSDIPSRPWLPALPTCLPSAAVGGEAMGLVDEPSSQTQRSLMWAPSQGHLAVVGALGSGTTAALAAIATGLTARHRPDALHLYLIDQANSLSALDLLPHCGARVAVSDGDRFSRLLDLLSEEVDQRQADGAGVNQVATIVVMIDGGAALRQFLGDHDNIEDAERFERVAAVGPQVGVVMVIAADQPAAIPVSVLSRSGERWVLSLNDPFEASLLGVEPRTAIVNGPAGRGIASSNGCEFQLVSPDDLVERVAAIADLQNSNAGRGNGPRKLGMLPAVVFAAELGGANTENSASVVAANGPDEELNLLIGLDVRQLRARGLSLNAGDHALVAGPARSGRTNLLALLAHQFAEQRPTGWIGVVPGRRIGALGSMHSDCIGSLGDVLDSIPHGREVLLVIDDADSVEDSTGRLATLLNTSTLDGDTVAVQVVVAGRTDGLRANYGHWTTIIRRQRRGVLLGSTHDLDADLFSAMLPRRTTGASLPGRGWLIQHGVVEAVQVGLLQHAAA